MNQNNRGGLGQTMGRKQEGEDKDLTCKLGSWVCKTIYLFKVSKKKAVSKGCTYNYKLEENIVRNKP